MTFTGTLHKKNQGEVLYSIVFITEILVLVTYMESKDIANANRCLYLEFYYHKKGKSGIHESGIIKAQ
jgi:hypothetical protein